MAIIKRYWLLLFFVQIVSAENYQWSDFPSHRLNVGAIKLSVASQKDFSFIGESGEHINKSNTDGMMFLFAVHLVKDGHSYRISPNVAILGTAMLGAAFSGIGNDASFVIWEAVLYALNPTIEYYLWQKYIPVSIGAGYNTDWFLFSPGRELYFKPHIDLNVMFKLGIWFKLTGSFAYLVTDTYDLKRGPRFEFRLGI